MNPIRTFLRRLAGVLAGVALLSAAARPVLACGMGPMDHAPAAVAPAAHEGHTGQAAHAGHAAGHTMPAVPASATDDAPADRSSRPAPACDHLVGCAVMIVSTAPAIAVVPVTAPESATSFVAAAIDSPTIPLETPPPRD